MQFVPFILSPLGGETFLRENTLFKTFPYHIILEDMGFPPMQYFATLVFRVSSSQQWANVEMLRERFEWL
tara:strand:- start:247 stop:456 length:210 start_codon:yes stop_codon:yes gene_type:complete